MRVGLQDTFWVWQANILNHLVRQIPCFSLAKPFMDHRHFDKLLANAHRRVQGRHRLLINHRYLRTPYLTQLVLIKGAKVCAFKFYRAANNPAIYT